MNKKIVTVGSICTVAILIGISFTTVVGHQNRKIIIEKESPLYQIRARIAMEEEQIKPFKYDYIGKGKFMTFLPSLENKLKYIFDIDISPEKLNEIKQSIQSNPEILNNLPSNFKDANILNYILELLNISIESDGSKPRTEEGEPTCTDCYTTGDHTVCAPGTCNCFENAFVVLMIMGIITIIGGFILFPLAFMVYFYGYIVTSLNRCDTHPSVLGWG